MMTVRELNKWVLNVHKRENEPILKLLIQSKQRVLVYRARILNATYPSIRCSLESWKQLAPEAVNVHALLDKLT